MVLWCDSAATIQARRQSPEVAVARHSDPSGSCSQRKTNASDGVSKIIKSFQSFFSWLWAAIVSTGCHAVASPTRLTQQISFFTSLNLEKKSTAVLESYCWMLKIGLKQSMSLPSDVGTVLNLLNQFSAALSDLERSYIISLASGKSEKSSPKSTHLTAQIESIVGIRMLLLTSPPTTYS